MTNETKTAAASEGVVSTRAQQQISLPGIWDRCRDFVTEQSAGEWSEKDIADDTDKLFSFISDEIARSGVPDMLRLLQTISILDELHTTSLPWDLIRKIRAAIAKATGAE